MSELADLADRVAGWATGGEQIEAYAAHSRDTDVEVYQGGIETLSSSETIGVGVRVVLTGDDGARQGFAYTGVLDDASLRACVASARDNARFATPDAAVGLAEPDGVDAAVLDLYRDEIETWPTDEKVSMAMELERRVRAADARIRSLRSASYGDAAVEVALASSTGMRSWYRRSACSLVAYAIAGDADDTQTGFGYSVGRSPSELDIEHAARMAADRATRLLGAGKPASARVAVVFDPTVTATLLGIIGGTLNGEAVQKGRSLFAGRIGEEVAVGSLTLTDDPTDPRAYGASPFDAEGLATRRLPLIEHGVLARFVHNTVSARRAGDGQRSTASAVRAGFKGTPSVGCRALSLAPGSSSPEAIIAGVGEGILVQSVSGVHSGVNPVSGDFSVGAEGLRISGGALGAPLREFTIASTLQRMLTSVTAVGSDQEWLPGGAAGCTLAVDGMQLSGA